MGPYDAVPVPMMGPYDAVRLLRDRFPNLVPLFSDPDSPDPVVPEPYSSYSRLAEEVSHQREDRSLVESFCSFINELVSSKEYWIEEALGDMLEGFAHDEAFVLRLRPHLNAQAEEKLKAAKG
jgi:hypothetical protein